MMLNEECSILKRTAMRDTRRGDLAYNAVFAGGMGICKPKLGRCSCTKSTCLMRFACELQEQEYDVGWYVNVNYDNKSTSSDGPCIQATTTRALLLTRCAYELQGQEHYVWWYVYTNFNNSTVAGDMHVWTIATRALWLLSCAYKSE